jgi:energy-coupling factor transporter ATP-binding protein EcfA2
MGLPDDQVKLRVEKALAAVNMTNFANRTSFHLSVGEKKRIAVATVLSMEPKILALDEPSAGLDPRARRNLIGLLGSLDDQALLISTHDMRLAAELCSRAIVLDSGRIIATGPAAEILNNRDLMESHGLETP